MPAAPKSATRVLLLGGSTEASVLARLIAEQPEFEAILSLAGRTQNPKPAPVGTRSGGFGGVAGLASYIRRERIHAVVDATHPFAARISANAVAACEQSGCTLIAIERPAWQPQPGDNWTSVPNVASAIAALGPAPRRVLTTIGRQQLHELEAHPHHHYIIRVIDPPDAPLRLPGFTLIATRGPFTVDDDIALLEREKIDIVVAKNSGGDAAVSKLVAARALSIPVVMVARPPPGGARTVPSPAAALEWLLALHGARTDRGA